MTSKRKNNQKQNEPIEKDSVYVLKLILLFILGCLWVSIGAENSITIPVGFIFGLLLVSHEHFQIDRKIEYAVLLIATILSYIAPIGFVLTAG